jgi:Flp pilus assembly protein TadG
MRRLLNRRRGERGSMAVEMVLLTPVLMGFVMLVVAFGRYVSVQGDIEAAARDAARAASLATSRSEAESVARSTIDASLDDSTQCNRITVGGSWEPGGQITVSLGCSVSMSGLGLIGLPGNVGVDADSAVPLDPYRRYE